MNFLTGVIKPSGMTSHDVVNICRKIFNERRIGHMGTLDPLASGVMVIGVGSAARLCNYLSLDDKTYVVEIEFGYETNTYDIEGEVVEEYTIPEEINSCEYAESQLKMIVGTFSQTPPSFSAVKINGIPAYKYARKGENIDLTPREVTVYDAYLLESSKESWKVELRVSKGTYIRSIVHDLGKRIGCGAVVRSLDRISCGELWGCDCLDLEILKNSFEKGCIKPLDAPKMIGFKSIEADEVMLKRIENGNSLRYNSKWELIPGEMVSIISKDKLLAIYQVEDLTLLNCICKFDGPIDFEKW